MKREPKDDELWHGTRNGRPVVERFMFGKFVDEHFIPIAPVISHELARELVAALTMTEHLYQRGILFVNKAIYDEVHNSRKSVLTKAEDAGLDGNS